MRHLYIVYETDDWGNADATKRRGVFTSRRAAVESIIAHVDIVVERFFQPSVVAQYSERSLVASAKRRMRKILNQAGVVVIQAKNLGYAIVEVEANGWDGHSCNSNEPAGKQEESDTDEIFI